MFKKILSLSLRVVTSVFLLYLLFRYLDIDFPSVLLAVRSADRGALAVSFWVFMSLNVIALFRWAIILRGAGLRIPFMRIVVSFCGGLFFNVFLPIGGDVVRSLDLGAFVKRTKEITATVLLDRLSGYVALVLVAVTATAWGWDLVRHPGVLGALVLLSLLLIAMLFVLFNRRLYEFFHRFSSAAGGKDTSRALVRRIGSIAVDLHHELHLFKDRRRVLFFNLLLSVVIQALLPISSFFLARALGSDAPLLSFFVFVPIVSAISMLPSIGGLGLRDASTSFFFESVGMPQHIAIAISLLNFAFVAFSAAIGGLIYGCTVSHRRIQRSAS